MNHSVGELRIVEYGVEYGGGEPGQLLGHALKDVLVGTLPGHQSDQPGREFGGLHFGGARAVGQTQIVFPLLEIFCQLSVIPLLIGAHHDAAAGTAEQQYVVSAGQLMDRRACLRTANQGICLATGLEGIVLGRCICFIVFVVLLFVRNCTAKEGFAFVIFRRNGLVVPVDKLHACQNRSVGK